MPKKSLIKKKRFFAYITYVIYKPTRIDPPGYTLYLYYARALKTIYEQKIKNHLKIKKL